MQEKEVFAAAVVSDNAKGLVHVFFAQRGTSKVKSYEEKESRDDMPHNKHYEKCTSVLCVTLK